MKFDVVYCDAFVMNQGREATLLESEGRDLAESEAEAMELFEDLMSDNGIEKTKDGDYRRIDTGEKQFVMVVSREEA